MFPRNLLSIGSRLPFTLKWLTFKSMAGGDSEEQDGGGGGIAVETAKPELKEPAKYAVLLHNDDYTTMEFVLEVLQRFFKKQNDDAMQIMLRVHNEGKGVAGIYTQEIAETKVVQVSEYARSHGHPLRCTAEPA
jgi:ATP-dependent Clp protease adaptor protein ClpS